MRFEGDCMKCDSVASLDPKLVGGELEVRGVGPDGAEWNSVTGFASRTGGVVGVDPDPERMSTAGDFKFFPYTEELG